jgi:hypothetical protein
MPTANPGSFMPRSSSFLSYCPARFVKEQTTTRASPRTLFSLSWVAGT